MESILFEHNRTAYENACAMLKEKGCAAVIHPTGTGKSFIAFQLCADHPDKIICWLSPSEYIFQTQMENWEEAGGAKPANIHFFTYARLMLMQPEELAELKPDYIILDEFHRCGAKMWGQGVQRLLETYTAVPVLGLSATSIRYLDGQRDMADELFDGNIASELSLGEAIVRGILNPPKYVLSLYSWQKELERYRERAKRAKNKAVRAEAEKYLEALRRALEKADGLDEIFYKHMVWDVRHEKNEEATCQIDHGENQQHTKSGQQVKNCRKSGRLEESKKSDRLVKTCGESAQTEKNKKSNQKDNACGESIQANDDRRYGKYLVFCADYDHMQEMMDKVPEWFHKVDKEPHIYYVYSEDPQSEQSFKDFKADESNHLKLLFCIDMLNEGIHVDDVSGVILLRPTISPIIYKQQIGRALSAGAKKNAVIFDVVMNIENLYSIGTIEEEMQGFVTYYRSHGMGDAIVNEHFRVIDEVQDCMRLFRKLNETLGASWEMMYCAARTYFEEHGDLEASKRYITEEGYSLGQWLDTQRKVRAGKVKGSLTDDQIQRLDALGMRWQSKADHTWEKYFAAAKKYYDEHGNLLINVRNGQYEGLDLGKWLAQLRVCRKSNIQKNGLTPAHIQALNEIGMVWDVPDYLWEQNYHSALEYHREHGDLNVPCQYVDANGVRLGAWLANLRFANRGGGNGRAELSKDQIRRLDELGMVWDNKNTLTWEHSYAAACRYRKQYGNINIPISYVTEDGCHLGRWLRRQKNNYYANLSEERKRKLREIGV